MSVGFYHVERQSVASDVGYLCARALVKSVRVSMPGVKVVQFTDLASTAVKGVDAVRRKPSEPMALLRMRHQAGVEGEWLFVDTDVIIQKSCRPVFKRSFDIAVTTRNWPHLKAAVGFSERMPFNSGVMFSRCPRFWGEAYTRLRQLDEEKQQWMGDQEVICEMVTEDPLRYHVRHLSGTQYNFPPVVRDDVADAAVTQEQAYIVHYKGLACDLSHCFSCIPYTTALDRHP